jgi:hypothetical protein
VENISKSFFKFSQEICDYLVSRQVLVHLRDNEDKFHLIVYMLKKLFSLVQVSESPF